MINYFDLIIAIQLTFLSVIVGGAFIVTQIERLQGEFSDGVAQVIGRSIFVAACLATFVVARIMLRAMQRPKPAPPPLRGDLRHRPFHKSSPNNAVVDGFHLRDYLWAILDFYQIERWRVSLLQGKDLLELSVCPLEVGASQKTNRVCRFTEAELSVHPGDVRDLIWGQARLMLLSDHVEKTEGPRCYLCCKRHPLEKPCCDLCGGKHHENDGCL